MAVNIFSVAIWLPTIFFLFFHALAIGEFRQCVKRNRCGSEGGMFDLVMETFCSDAYQRATLIHSQRRYCSHLHPYFRLHSMIFW